MKQVEREVWKIVRPKQMNKIAVSLRAARGLRGGIAKMQRMQISLPTRHESRTGLIGNLVENLKTVNKQKSLPDYFEV